MGETWRDEPSKPPTIVSSNRYIRQLGGGPPAPIAVKQDGRNDNHKLEPERPVQKIVERPRTIAIRDGDVADRRVGPRLQPLDIAGRRVQDHMQEGVGPYDQPDREERPLP